ncbi:MAG TPA: serine hydrolase, partial [Cytophagales bacterium]
MKQLLTIGVTLLLFTDLGISRPLFSQPAVPPSLAVRIEKEVRQWMEEGDIPGLSLVLLKDGRQLIRTYGYADAARRKPVTPRTLFEIGSCSKAFTALALARLVSQGKLGLDDRVADYLPWFRVQYQHKEASITVRQLAHHTSGIPWSTIAKIPRTNHAEALEQTVRQLVGQELDNPPGKVFTYATINYDVLALVIQRASGQPFEAYLQRNVIEPLQLRHTTVGIGSQADPADMATGYKIGFFGPRRYPSPVFRGNNAAGYVLSDAGDMAAWLRVQLGPAPAGWARQVAFTHQRDTTVPLHGMAAYASGWDVSLSGNGEISHSGLNPNYSSYVVFRPGQKLGVVVLANSNSSYTPVIGNRIMQLLAGEEPEKTPPPGDGSDKAFSIICFALGAYIVGVLTLLGVAVVRILRRKRPYNGLSRARLGAFGGSLLLLLPFLYGIYLVPQAVFDFNWPSLLVWTPVSVPLAIALLLTALGISYLYHFVSLCFPEPDKFRKAAPRLLLFSTLSGLANMLIIMLVTSSLGSEVALQYLLFYYLLTLSVYLLGRRYVQLTLIRLSRQVTYELRLQLIGKIFSTSYQRFEKMDRGRVYTTINDDVDTIGEASNLFVMLVTNVITAGGAFLFLAATALWATLLTVVLILALVTLYSVVIRRTHAYFEEARNSRDVFMRLVNGMIDGFKELSLSRNKKAAYQEDMAASADVHRVKTATAGVQFVNASLAGETVLILLLGIVVYAFPKVFAGIPVHTLMSFVIILLYLTGPVNTILGAVPAVMNLRVAWRRTHQFLADIPANAG